MPFYSTQLFAFLLSLLFTCWLWLIAKIKPHNGPVCLCLSLLDCRCRALLKRHTICCAWYSMSAYMMSKCICQRGCPPRRLENKLSAALTRCPRYVCFLECRPRMCASIFLCSHVKKSPLLCPLAQQKLLIYCVKNQNPIFLQISTLHTIYFSISQIILSHNFRTYSFVCVMIMQCWYKIILNWQEIIN